MKILFTKRVDTNDEKCPDCNIIQYHIVSKFIYAVAYIWPNDIMRSYVRFYPIIEDFDRNGCVGNDIIRHYDETAYIDIHYERNISVDQAIAVLRGAMVAATASHRYFAEDNLGISYDRWAVKMVRSTEDKFTFTKMRNAPDGVERTIQIEWADFVSRASDTTKRNIMSIDDISHLQSIDLTSFTKEDAYGARL